MYFRLNRLVAVTQNTLTDSPDSGQSRLSPEGHDRLLASPCKISVLNSAPMTVPGWRIIGL